MQLDCFPVLDHSSTYAEESEDLSINHDTPRPTHAVATLIDLKITRLIEVYENERYSPISGWSSRGLLMTDRDKFSNNDGSVSFASIEEYETAFISCGWIWVNNEWNVDLSLANVDESGWTYSADFSSLENEHVGSPTKNMIHFVRRKRLLRSQLFTGKHIHDLGSRETCSYCDLEEIDKLTSMLLEAAMTASLKLHPRIISIPKINAIKNDIIEALHLNNSAEEISSIVKIYSAITLKALIEDFFSRKGTSLWTMASSALSSGQTNFEHISKRTSDISQAFSPSERTELARLIIRKYDYRFEFHCNEVNCKESGSGNCPFTTEVCPNADCGIIYSRKHGEKHDSICPHKVIDCDRLCGEKVVRRTMRSHLSNACELRPVTCPYAEVGCTTDVVCRTLPRHIEDSTQAHMLLTLHRVKEQQDVILKLHQRTHDLENKLTEQNNRLTGVCEGLRNAIVAVEIAEARSSTAYREEISKLDSKAAKGINQVVTDMHGEIAKLKTSLHSLSKEIGIKK